MLCKVVHTNVLGVPVRFALTARTLRTPCALLHQRCERSEQCPKQLSRRKISMCFSHRRLNRHTHSLCDSCGSLKATAQASSAASKMCVRSDIREERDFAQVLVASRCTSSSPRPGTTRLLMAGKHLGRYGRKSVSQPPTALVLSFT